MRRLIPVLLIAVAHAGQSPNDLSLRLVHFHEHYDPFLRKYFGCPPAARQVTECDPKSGSVDYHEFTQACREAIKLFALPTDPTACTR